MALCYMEQQSWAVILVIFNLLQEARAVFLPLLHYKEGRAVVLSDLDQGQQDWELRLHCWALESRLRRLVLQLYQLVTVHIQGQNQESPVLLNVLLGWVLSLLTENSVLCSFVCPPPRWNRTRTNQLALPVEVGILSFVTTKPTNHFVFLSLPQRRAHSERLRTCIALAVTHSPITNRSTSLIFLKSDFLDEQKRQPQNL